MTRGSCVEAAVLLAAAVGLASAARVHLFVERRASPPPRADERYQGLRAALPLRGRVGYRSDLPAGGPYALRYAQAAYALAPLELVADDGSFAFVVADLSAPGGAEKLVRRARLRLVRVAPSGAAVLARGGKP